MEPIEKLTVLITLMRRLQSVMDHEVALLRNMQIGELSDLQDEKAVLSEAYELEMDHLRRNPEILGSLLHEFRATLEEETRAFQKTVQDNALALRAAGEVIERIMARLSESLTAAQAVGPGYGAAPSSTGRVISVAFDRQL